MSPLTLRLACQPHRVFVADVCHAGQRIEAAGLWNREAFSIMPIGLVFSMPLVIFTRHVPHWPMPWQLTILVDARAEAVDALVDVDARLDRLLAKIGAVREPRFPCSL